MAGLCEGGNEPPGSLKAMHLSTCVDFGPMFIDIYDVVQRAATRGNPRVGTQSETILFDAGVVSGRDDDYDDDGDDDENKDNINTQAIHTKEQLLRKNILPESEIEPETCWRGVSFANHQIKRLI
ncbi:hypothetical protein ANN_16992 [Periplaneta americana]|uniref:Uncharacterized protein n=1 Tax=Periplaneta americana TaxID=6978 RepID=A0ABQ8STT0_PERAM|nr:hypothetical protein ANN_16992 [Periplaneta americana]